jgi:hypothetical protein
MRTRYYESSPAQKNGKRIDQPFVLLGLLATALIAPTIARGSILIFDIRYGASQGANTTWWGPDSMITETYDYGSRVSAVTRDFPDPTPFYYPNRDPNGTPYYVTYNYGAGTGFTPNIDIGYSADSTTLLAPSQGAPNWPRSLYYATNGSYFITFNPDPNYAVQVKGFDAYSEATKRRW